MTSVEPSPEGTNTPAVFINFGHYDDQTGDIHPHELLEEYTPGGFHPVALSDTLHDERYTIRHKLGFGMQATVWLAWNDEDEYVPSSLDFYRAFSSDLDGLGRGLR